MSNTMLVFSNVDRRSYHRCVIFSNFYCHELAASRDNGESVAVPLGEVSNLYEKKWNGWKDRVLKLFKVILGSTIITWRVGRKKKWKWRNVEAFSNRLPPLMTFDPNCCWLLPNNVSYLEHDEKITSPIIVFSTWSALPRYRYFFHDY